MANNQMKSRKDYLSKDISHCEYYAQFVNEQVKYYVITRIGLERIKNSTDPHFKDIPLREWDSLYPLIVSEAGRSISKANNDSGVSLSDCVCLAKQAARMIRDDERP